ncbi:MAG: iron-sulfur cluster assembly accessory protein [candidate division NC10 bacterium]|nr:iron-sulfur cluster assembly accessory protein [candidate division NC10 bacterium]
MLTITDPAQKKILALLESQGRQGSALRVAITGRGPGGFQYDLRFVGGAERGPQDLVVDAEGFQVFIDAQSAPNLKGATLDFVEGINQSGFKIDNPNSIWTDPRAKAVQQVIDTRINPGVAMHGGYVTLLDVKDDVAYIALGGGCQGCGMADVTLKQGIEVMIREEVPEIRQIMDTTDHAGGTNPFYQPSKGGQSPFA